LQVYLTRWMARYARREGLSAATLLDAIQRAEKGLVDADLGGGLIKQRVARAGKGRSGGYRTIIAYRRGNRAVFLYGFAKNDRDNIGSDELTELRIVGSNWLNAKDETLVSAVNEGSLQEVPSDPEEDEQIN
jgi:hypothetical protein